MVRRSTTRTLLAPAIVLSVIFTSLWLAGCGSDRTDGCDSCGRYLPQNSPANVVHSLQQSYRNRDVDGYAPLLADDFRFYFDPQTRIVTGLPESWNRFEDSTATALSIFKSDQISDVRITLRYGTAALPVTEPGRERWKRIDVHADLEVDQKPSPAQPEGLTYLIINRLETFYFRKGRNPADTLATSRTAGNFYVVEWREPDTVSKPGMDASSEERTAWGDIKALCLARKQAK